VELVLDPEEASTREFCNALQQRELKGYDAALKMYPKAVCKSKLFRPETNKDEEGNQIPTGKVVVKFARTAAGVRKDGTAWTSRPPELVDAKGKPLSSGTVIFGGSKIKVSFTVSDTTMPGGAGEPDKYYAKLVLEGVQVLNLVASYQRDAAALGFTEEEGYSSTDAFGEQTPAATDEEAEGAAAGAVPDF
jgi:hypothetical protein